MNHKINGTRICNMICALLMLALLVCQFIPFWSIDGHASSIQGYVWLPEYHEPLTEYFETEFADYRINDIISVPIVMIIVSALGCFLCLFKSDRVWTMVFPLFCGVFGIFGYLTKPVFQLGNLWQLHLTLCIAMVVVAVISLIQYIMQRKD